MNRQRMFEQARSGEPWEILIIGGGATGLGTAIDAASRGYRTLLLERGDLAHGTSSRSTKLIHGGVRYLQQGNISLVIEALRERGLLRRNAPHLVNELPFVVPTYDWWESPFYGIGLKAYDVLAGKLGFGASRLLSREETVEHIPTVETEGLRGGVLYYDGQFDDARLAVHMARTAADHGATLLNYVSVEELLHRDDLVRGVVAVDRETEEELELEARVVVNATGPFADGVRKLDDPEAEPMIQASQGVHIVLDRAFLPGDSAIMVPHTEDGRVLFAIPWHGRVLVGTTDTALSEVDPEPRPLQEELDFLLDHAARYLEKDPGPDDVLSAFAGIRPLVTSGDTGADTAEISRDHTVRISPTGLMTVAGGKWTTYRRMAKDAVDRAALIGDLEERPCRTRDLPIHGQDPEADRHDLLAAHGTDAVEIRALMESDSGLAESLHSRLPYRRAEVVWAVRHEMAVHLDDVLSRRTRSLLLDARASIEAAPEVARLMAEETGKDEEWQRREVDRYRALAGTYLMG